MSSPSPPLRPGAPFGLWAAFAIVAAGPLAGLWVGLWAGTAGQYRPSATAMSIWLRHLGDPEGAVPPRVSMHAAAALFTGAATIAVVWMAGAAIFLARTRHRGLQARGLATRRDARGLSASAVVAKLATLRPATRTGGVHDVGVFVGFREGRETTWATVEDTFAVIGPARSGKTSRLIAPTIARWPGAAVVTGLRPDVLDWTQSRSRHGRRWVFDPSASSDTYFGATPLPWSPLSGCRFDVQAAARAKALLSGLGPALGQDVYWRAEGEKVLICYLLAGAHGGYRMGDVVAWSAAESSPVPMEALTAAGLHNWATILENMAARNDRYRAGVWGQVTQALFPLNLSTMIASCDLAAGQGFDPSDFATAGTDTLYILGDPDEQKAVGGLAVALIAAITAAGRAAARRGGRLDPPLLVALDEAANTAPMHTVDQLLSSGGGSGICTMIAFQSLGQARETYGNEKGDAIVRDLSTIKVLFGGEGNADDLRELGALLGERDEEVASISHPRGLLSSQSNVQRSTRLRPVLSPAELRSLGHERPGEVLVIPRTAKAMRTRLPAVWERDPMTVG
jgi:type IV secretion system protein VirD4